MKIARSAASFVLFLSIVAPSAAQNPAPSQVELKVSAVAGSVSMIEGVNGFAGGNVGVSVGSDGMFIIDDELEQMSPKLRAALSQLSKSPIRFVINTHWHGDHTGGNAMLGQAGAVIVAHDSVRQRLSAAELEKKAKGTTEPKDGQAPADGAALPVVTFSQDVTLHLNGDTVHVFHVPPAHTDGDAVVHFEKANVIHTGDLFVSHGYPFVDMNSGGNFEGFIGAADAILKVADERTRIIPGHGSISTRADVQAWRDMLERVRARVAKLIAAGKTLEQVIAAKPTADLDEKVGGGSITPAKIVEAAYRSLTLSKAKPAAH